jgi:hypothetical protein
MPQSLRNIAVFRKTGEDKRDWMHFEGFGGSSKSFVTHKVIQKIHEEEDSFLKKTAIKVKNILK